MLIQSGAEQKFYTMLESFGVGLSVFDYDRDGLSDIIMSGGGTFDRDKKIYGLPGALYRAKESFQFQDVATQACFSTQRHYSHSCAIADCNKRWLRRCHRFRIRRNAIFPEPR